MTDLTFRSEDARFGVSIPRRVLGEILEHCAAAGGAETGGVLIGEYTQQHDCAIVHLATGPTTDSVATRTTFRRGIAGLQALLNRLWHRQRRYYLGEWHFHPGGTPDPSDVDRAQLRAISEDPDYRCPEPVLLIVGGEPTRAWKAAAFVFPQGKRAVTLHFANMPDEIEQRGRNQGANFV